MVCAVGNEKGEILDRVSIPTETPDITMPKLLEYFQGQSVEALGIGCFGPVDLDPASGTYGFITTTPKLAWRNCDICGYFRERLKVPVGFDTDVNGSMLGEATWGCARGLDTAIYITVGTGVGVGVLAGGRLLHGMQHPEGGHILLPRGRMTLMRENARITKPVWRGWQPVLPLKRAGVKKRRNFLTGRKYGSWKRIIWRMPLQII